MITLTITLKSTEHQIVLGYKSKATCDAAIDAASEDDEGKVVISDDYGQSAQYLSRDVASINMTDLDAYRDYIVAKKAWAYRTETAISVYCQQHPDLAPYVGRGPELFRG